MNVMHVPLWLRRLPASYIKGTYRRPYREDRAIPLAIRKWMVSSLGVQTNKGGRVGSPGDCTWILGLTDYRVVELDRHDDGRLTIEIERRVTRRYVCSGCGRRTGRVRDAKTRTWDDLPWAEHPVTLRYPLRRLCCRHCGIRTERVEFADPHARLTRRFRQRIGLDCQSMPTSHAAARHTVSWGIARRAERSDTTCETCHCHAPAIQPPWRSGDDVTTCRSYDQPFERQEIVLWTATDAPILE
jgi:hypothetical protein